MQCLNPNQLSLCYFNPFPFVCLCPWANLSLCSTGKVYEPLKAQRPRCRTDSYKIHPHHPQMNLSSSTLMFCPKKMSVGENGRPAEVIQTYRLVARFCSVIRSSGLGNEAEEFSSSGRYLTSSNSTGLDPRPRATLRMRSDCSNPAMHWVGGHGGLSLSEVPAQEIEGIPRLGCWAITRLPVCKSSPTCNLCQGE